MVLSSAQGNNAFPSEGKGKGGGTDDDARDADAMASQSASSTHMRSLEELAQQDSSGVARLVVHVCKQALASAARKSHSLQIKRNSELDESIGSILVSLFLPTMFSICKDIGIQCKLQMELESSRMIEVYNLEHPSNRHEFDTAQFQAIMLGQRWFSRSLGQSSAAYRVRQHAIYILALPPPPPPVYAENGQLRGMKLLAWSISHALTVFYRRVACKS